MTNKCSNQSSFPFGEIRNELVLIIVLLALFFFIKERGTMERRGTGHPNSCIANLKMIDGAKLQWAVENKQFATAIPASSVIFGGALYIRTLPLCPAGGTYSLNAVSTKPTCSKSGAPDFHTL